MLSPKGFLQVGVDSDRSDVTPSAYRTRSVLRIHEHANTFCFLRIQGPVMLINSRVLVPAILVFVFQNSALLAADNAVPKGKLKPIEIPQIEMIENAKDEEFEKIVGWMDEIVANIESTSFDCRTKIEATTISTPTSEGAIVVGVVAAMRIAKKSGNSLERYVVVEQKPDSNGPPVQDERLKIDNRRHADILRKKGRMHYCSLSTFDYNVGEIRTEVDWDPKSLQYHRFYDPISVCTTNIGSVLSGHALPGSKHMFRIESIKGTLRVGEYVHVLLKCPVYSGGIVRNHVQFVTTFREGVPVQFGRLAGVNPQTGRPQMVEIMRSYWRVYGEGEDKQLLPTYILGMEQDGTKVGQLEISCDWKLGREVSESLFDAKTIGDVAPAEDIVVGIPKRLLEMMSEPSAD